MKTVSSLLYLYWVNVEGGVTLRGSPVVLGSLEEAET